MDLSGGMIRKHLICHISCFFTCVGFGGLSSGWDGLFELLVLPYEGHPGLGSHGLVLTPELGIDCQA